MKSVSILLLLLIFAPSAVGQTTIETDSTSPLYKIGVVLKGLNITYTKEEINTYEHGGFFYSENLKTSKASRGIDVSHFRDTWMIHSFDVTGNWVSSITHFSEKDCELLSSEHCFAIRDLKYGFEKKFGQELPIFFSYVMDRNNSYFQVPYQNKLHNFSTGGDFISTEASE